MSGCSLSGAYCGVAGCLFLLLRRHLNDESADFERSRPSDFPSVVLAIYKEIFRAFEKALGDFPLANSIVQKSTKCIQKRVLFFKPCQTVFRMLGEGVANIPRSQDLHKLL